MLALARVAVGARHAGAAHRDGAEATQACRRRSGRQSTSPYRRGHQPRPGEVREANGGDIGRLRSAAARACVWYQSSCSRHSTTNSAKVSGPSSASASLAATSSFPDRTPSWLVSAFRKTERHCSAGLAAAWFWGSSSCPAKAGVVSASASTTAIDAYLAISILVWFCLKRPLFRTGYRSAMLPTALSAQPLARVRVERNGQVPATVSGHRGSSRPSVQALRQQEAQRAPVLLFAP